MSEEKKRYYNPSGGVSMTRQSDALEADVNRIMEKWMATGMVRGTSQQARYGDFTGIEDFHTCLNRMQEAEEAFMQLPAKIREYCSNDPGQFLELVYDENRVSELEALGLLESEKPEAARPVVEPEKGSE